MFTIRRQSVDLGCAIVWGAQHCFLTSIVPTEDKIHLVVTAAMVNIVSCVADAQATPQGKAFPAALTEKYIRHEQPEPYSMNTVCYVLVAPKAVSLAPGSLVDVDGTPYEVLCAHTLDTWKNEFEIMRKADS
ncbi:hypothetical protein SDC9_187363 [bioreactor metagenome]|uniref:Uncharacterized protein n=1 Tax=bioreactor metagenome TaxID=1076179 RepID=A0A645HNL0_9ZZZZ